MVSNTAGAWVKDGVTDQTTNATHVSTANSRLTIFFVCAITVLLCATAIAF